MSCQIANEKLVALVAVDDSRVPWWCLSVAFLGTCNALANVPKCGRAR